MRLVARPSYAVWTIQRESRYLDKGSSKSQIGFSEWKTWENSQLIFQRALKRHQKTKTRTSTYVVKLLGCSCLTSSNICDVSRVSACENPLRLFSFKSRYLGVEFQKRTKRTSDMTPFKKTLTDQLFATKKYASRRKS